MNKIVLSLVLTVVTVSLSNAQNTETFKDNRDGNKYKIVEIGRQVWMAENLNYQINNSWCDDNDSSNCSKYGRLYTCETAKNVCPTGWHLPTKAEFEILLDNFGGEGSGAYIALKEGGNSGFNTLFGGNRSGSGHYVRGFGSYFWSSTESNSDFAWGMGMSSYDEKASIRSFSGSWGFSVRCVQN